MNDNIRKKYNAAMDKNMAKIQKQINADVDDIILDDLCAGLFIVEKDVKESVRKELIKILLGFDL